MELHHILSLKELLFYSESRGVKKEFKSSGPGIKIPIVVLVNESTASASEILAGAIKIEKLEFLLVKNLWKGLIQTIYNLSDGYGLVLTTERYLTPSLFALDKKGLEPDISVEYEIDKTDPEMDSQLKKGIEILKEQI